MTRFPVTTFLIALLTLAIRVCTADPCDAACDNLFDAVTSCSVNTNDCVSLCPTALASASVCSSCLATVDLNPTLAVEVASLYYDCQPLCTAQCNNVYIAPTACSDAACLCPTLSVSGSACSACLVSSGNPTFAADIASAYSADCVNLCTAQCNNIYIAATSCSNDECLCPTLSASGSACSACLASSGDPTDAATISEILATACPKTTSSGPSSTTFSASTTSSSTSGKTTSTTSSATGTTTIAASECTTECGLVVSAASSCSDDACFCSTLLAAGPVCSDCWVPLNITEASLLGSGITSCSAEGYSAGSAASTSTKQSTTTTHSTVTTSASSPPVDSALSICDPECGGILDVVGSCSTNLICACSTILAGGAECSSCLALYNVTDADIFATAITDCSVLSTGSNTVLTTPNTNTGPTDALVNPTSTTTTMTTSPTPASTSVPVSAIIGGAVGGVALLVCIVVFIILWRRIRRIEHQGPIELPTRDFDDSGDKDTGGAPNVEPVVEEQTERYGTARPLRYPAEIESGNLRENN